MTEVYIYKRRLPKLNLKGTVKLNIGCCRKQEKGFINLDLNDYGQDIVWDVRTGIPFPDNSVDLIWSQHVMEHFTESESQAVLREMYRVLKVGGIMVHTTPHASDPTSCYFDHKTFWNEARVETIPTLSGIEGFRVIKNYVNEQSNRRAFRELVFEVQKVQ